MKILLSDNKHLTLKDAYLESMCISNDSISLTIDDKLYMMDVSSLSEGAFIMEKINRDKNCEGVLIYLRISNYNTSIINVMYIDTIDLKKFFKEPEKFLDFRGK